TLLGRPGAGAVSLERRASDLHQLRRPAVHAAQGTIRSRLGPRRRDVLAVQRRPHGRSAGRAVQRPARESMTDGPASAGPLSYIPARTKRNDSRIVPQQRPVACPENAVTTPDESRSRSCTVNVMAPHSPSPGGSATTMFPVLPSKVPVAGNCMLSL